MTACPDKLLLLHALVDEELDAAGHLVVEAHLRGCTACAEEFARVEAVRACLAASDLAFSAPAGLAARIAAGLPEAGEPRRLAAPRQGASRQTGWFAGGALTGLAAGVAVMLAVPQVTSRDVQDQLVASHVRSLLVSHLTDVPASDRHIVKPWFNGRIDFAPPVPDLAGNGFPLAGGRVDYVDGRTVAAIVYHRRLHPINVFVRPARGMALPGAVRSQEDGYNIIRWSAGGLDYWAISDLNGKELAQFQTLFQTRAAG